MQFVMHSYTFREYPLSEAFRNARRFGWDGLELQPCHFDRAKVETELPAAIALGKDFGIPIVCLDSGGDMISDDPKVVEATIAQVEKDLDTCAKCGVSLLNGGVGCITVDPDDFGKNGSAIAQDVHFERAAEAMKHLGTRAAKLGLTFVFEIHMNTLTDTFASTARLLDMIGLNNVKANPDCGNMFATSTAERDPNKLDLLKGRIGYYHFKNCRAVGTGFDFSETLATGNIDVYKWLEKVVSFGHDGPICIEYCGVGDPRGPAKQDLEYVKQSLEWIRGAD
jgi:sugar phosphate isomerase/epimerase